MGHDRFPATLLGPLLLALALVGLPSADAATDVKVDRLDGVTVIGPLLAIESGQLTVATDKDRQAMGFSEILSVTVEEPGAPSSPAPRVWIQLTDGSRVQASAFRESDETATIHLRGGDRLEIPTRSVRSVRLNPPRKAVDGQWNEILARPASVDVVVVLRDGSNLDYVEGALGSVSDTAVRFTFDGETVEVPRSRLEGFVYYVPQSDKKMPPVVCRAHDADGNVWQASGLTLSEGNIHVRTAAGIRVSLPLPSVAKLDFASGNVIYLSDIKPMRVQWTPFLASQVVSDGLSRLFQPRRNRGFGGGKLRLRFAGGSHQSPQFNKGLAVHCRTQLVYRLPDGFRHLTAWVGIDQAANAGDSARLVLSGDGRRLLDRLVTRQDPPFPIDLDIEAVRRLSILVDFPDDLAVTGQLDLCDLRITK